MEDPLLPLDDPMRDRLVFQRTLSRGTFGQVLLYHDKEYDEEVAIKFIEMGKTKFAIQCLSAPRNSRLASIASVVTVEEDLSECTIVPLAREFRRAERPRAADCRILSIAIYLMATSQSPFSSSKWARYYYSAVSPLSGIPAVRL